MKKIKICIAGYGVFGSQFLGWLKKNAPDIEILYIVEPNRHKRDFIKKLGISTYDNIYDVPANLIKNTLVVVDASPRGQGIINKEDYKSLGLAAIFQNGEESPYIGQLYYPGVTIQNKPPIYLKIPLCSGLAAIKIVAILRQRGLGLPTSIFGYHSKVTNTARNLTFNYEQSNQEIQKLFDIPANMNVVYLRGEPHSGVFTYHGFVSLKFSKTQSLENIVKALKNTKNSMIKTEKQEIDTLFHPKTHKTIIVEDGISTWQNTITIPTISYTPDVNFPINLAAIREIAQQNHKISSPFVQNTCINGWVKG